MKKVSNIFVLSGSLFILSALGLFIHNQKEALTADKKSKDVLTQLSTYIESSADTNIQKVDEITQTLDNNFSALNSIEIEGDEYMGYITIPSIDLQMPVMQDWSEEKLKKALNRYTGDFDNNLIIMGHNYTKGFAKLSKLKLEDTIYIKNISGENLTYKVKKIETLSENSVEEMVNSEYDLTLFTCTYGGKNRITVRCEKYIEQI